MSKSLYSLFVKNHNNTKNSFDRLKECVSIIHKSEAIKNKIHEKICNRVLGSIFGVTYIGIFSLLMQTSSQDTWWVEIAVVSMFPAIIVWGFSMGILCLITSIIVKLFNLKREHLRIFSKKLEIANNNLLNNKKLVIEMLEDPEVQHETLSFLKNIKTSSREKTPKTDVLIIERSLNELITILALKNHAQAASYVTSWLPSWLHIKNESDKEGQKLVEVSNISNIQDSFLKSINFTLEDKKIEIETEKEYNLKSML